MIGNEDGAGGEREYIDGVVADADASGRLDIFALEKIAERINRNAPSESWRGS
jgi:hypothetical protein